jgi:CubicO group peptidase (beta-lactamase class C family)
MMLVAALVEKLACNEPGIKSYFDALTARVLQPLGLTRTVVTGNTLETRKPGEVFYHDINSRLVKAVQVPNEPWVLDGYGNVNYPVGDGVGGLAMAASDFARFLSCFTDEQDNPLMTASQQHTMWRIDEPGFKAGMNGGWYTYERGTTLVHSHGGTAAGGHASAITRSDGFSLAVWFNGNASDHIVAGAPWDELIERIVDWPTHDLWNGGNVPVW